MNGPESFDSGIVKGFLDRIAVGDRSCAQDLLNVSMSRLRVLAKKIMSNIPGVKRWEDTDDLLQNASLRLWRALESSHPRLPADYFRLAAAVIRRELVDLSRKHFGPMGIGANMARSAIDADGQLIPTPASAPDETNDPEKLSRWAEFHEYVENLPDDERLMFDLMWYQGLTIAESGQLLDIPERTLRRRWKDARIRLYETLLKS